MRLSQFQPSKLEEVLQVIREKHSIRGSQDVRVDKSIIDEVRTILENTESEKVPPLAWGFKKKQILACLEIVALDRKGEIADKAAAILMTRPKGMVILKGFRKLIRLYEHKLLEKVIKVQLKSKGYDIFERTQFEPIRIKKWLLYETLGTGLFAEYKSDRKNKCLDDYLSTLPIIEKEGLYKWSWRYLLVHGNLEDIRRESSQRIYSEFIDKDNIKFFKKFCINYLNKLNKSEYWYEPILDLIAKEYGLPKGKMDRTAYENPFWDEINSSTKDELRKWLLKKRIEDFFGDDERSGFWKSYVEKGSISNAETILSNEGFMLDFGKFGVVEFKEIGNAAYIYPTDVFREYWRNAERKYHPSSFKDKSRTIKTVNWDGRILHFEGWQERAHQRIHRLLKI